MNNLSSSIKWAKRYGNLLGLMQSMQFFISMGEKYRDDPKDLLNYMKKMIDTAIKKDRKESDG